jgi:hypothetical protein
MHSSQNNFPVAFVNNLHRRPPLNNKWES